MIVWRLNFLIFWTLITWHSMLQSLHTSVLDLIITRANEDTVLNCKVEDPDLSDHYAVHCMLTLDKPTARRVEKT